MTGGGVRGVVSVPLLRASCVSLSTSNPPPSSSLLTAPKAGRSVLHWASELGFASIVRLCQSDERLNVNAADAIVRVAVGVLGPPPYPILTYPS